MELIFGMAKNIEKHEKSPVLNVDFNLTKNEACRTYIVGESMVIIIHGLYMNNPSVIQGLYYK